MHTYFYKRRHECFQLHLKTNYLDSFTTSLISHLPIPTRRAPLSSRVARSPSSPGGISPAFVPQTHLGSLLCRGSSPSVQPQSLHCHGKWAAWIPGQFSPMCKSFCFGEIRRTQAASILLASRLPHSGCEGCQQQESTAAGYCAAYCPCIWCHRAIWDTRAVCWELRSSSAFGLTLTLLLHSLGFVLSFVLTFLPNQ